MDFAADLVRDLGGIDKREAGSELKGDRAEWCCDGHPPHRLAVGVRDNEGARERAAVSGRHAPILLDAFKKSSDFVNALLILSFDGGLRR